MTDKIKIEIDGNDVDAEPGSMIIEAADNSGCYIPRFCYHKKLSIAANCRMCLVEVEKAPKPMPACTTPVTDGMKVFTRSPKTLEAQRYVLEFLLINHPLDCPVCDQGGECELQDLSMGFGRDDSLYLESKHCVSDQNLGPLISTEMTRCIHCTRCVRFGQEIAGISELGMTKRGGESQISTFVEHSMTSELSGNIIDLCPVGALTSKPFRFRARPWELKQRSSIASHDCLGSNISAHCKQDKVLRVAPKENEKINETWLSDRDRFSYVGLSHADRLKKPMIKHQGEWQEVEWAKAFEYAIKGLKEIIREHGPEQLGALVSPTATTEEGYLFQKIMRAMGSNNIDYRIQQSDFRDDESEFIPMFDDGLKIEDFSTLDVVFLVGSNIQREQPILGARVYATTRQSGRVVSINPVDFEFNFKQHAKSIVHPNNMVNELAAVAKVLGAEFAGLDLDINNDAYADAKAIAESLKTGERKAIVLGAIALNHPHAALIKQLARIIAKLTGAKIACCTSGPNSAGLHLAGALPHQKEVGKLLPHSGLNCSEQLQKALSGYLLFDIEPDSDFANASLAGKALDNANFVLAFSAFNSPALEQYADIIFPIVPSTETAGTFVNAEGTWQSFAPVADPLDEARPGWKVLRVFANMFGLDGFEYNEASEISNELDVIFKSEKKESKQEEGERLEMLLERVKKYSSGYELLKKVVFEKNAKLTRITEWPLYRTDALVRRSSPLQLSAGGSQLAVRLNENTAKKFMLNESAKVKVSQEEESVTLPLEIDARLPDGAAWVPAGYSETAPLGQSFGEIEVEKI